MSFFFDFSYLPLCAIAWGLAAVGLAVELWLCRKVRWWAVPVFVIALRVLFAIFASLYHGNPWALFLPAIIVRFIPCLLTGVVIGALLRLIQQRKMDPEEETE